VRLSTSPKVPEDAEKHFRIIDILLVFTTISNLVKCAICGEKVYFKSCDKQGLGFTIEVKCEKCKLPKFVPSCEKIGGKYEINFQFIFVMRILGLGSAGCNKFCGLMDLASSFLSQHVYETYIESIMTNVQRVANQFFCSAAKQEKEETLKANNTAELIVSGDGTWQKQGFTSLYGVASLIGYYTGKVVDICVKSSHCKKCEYWNKKCNTEEFAEWHEEHIRNNECDSNHDGPAGNMEVGAIVEMFKRSMEKLSVMYKFYIGDGDSKTFTGVKNAKPYGDNVQIYKKECVGHVQKRMGTRLRSLVKNVVEKVLSKGKIIKKKLLSGKGKLTAKLIDKLTIYYGLAIRRHSDSVENMKNAIWATFHHYSSTDKNPQHTKCPSGADSWCAWQRALAADDLASFHHDYEPFPNIVVKHIKPIYEELSSDELLERCLGGFTQNNNKILNHLIWKIAPKKVSSSSKIVELAANIAACQFNEGTYALLVFLHDIGVSLGPSAHEYHRKQDDERVKRADQQAAITTKEERIRRRQAQKDALEIAISAETLEYGPGIDDSM